ncbi:MAG: hypothetical protein HY812_07055 [Planctomycetes bacterium]|nr:hypothetical protein [Planctomycetota bacterium]
MRTTCAILLLLAAQPFAWCAGPDQMTLAELDVAFGPNVLAADPAGLGPPPGVRDDTVLRRWFGSAPGALNALVANDANLVDSLIVYCCLDLALRHRDDPGKWAPGAADYASVTEDLSCVTVRLREGLRWQFPAVDRDDPRYSWLVELFADEPPELCAADVKFTHDVIMNPDAGVDHAHSYFEGSRVEILDRRTFRVHWERFYVYALETSISWTQILPQFLYARDEDGHAIPAEEFGKAFRQHWHNSRLCGYGPYEFVRMEPDTEIVLRRMDDFPVFRPAIQEIRWEIVRDGEATVLRMLDGQVDYNVFMPQQYRKYVLEAKEGSPFRGGRFRTKPYEKLEYIYLGWCCKRPPFDDARVRNAMSLAFHREAFLSKVYFDLAALVDSPVYYRHPHHNPDLPAIPFDLGKASKLLDEAGWGDQDGDGVRDKTIGEARRDLRFTMITFTDSTEFDTVLAVYREDLKKIGVDMQVERLPWGQFQKRVYVDQEVDAYTGLVGLGWEVDFYDYFHSQGGSNGGGFRDAEADELIVKYRETAAGDERLKLALRIQEILHREQPFTFFLRRIRMSAYQPWLENVEYAVARPQLLSFGWYRAK